MPTSEQTIRSYFQALESGNYDSILAHFSKFAIVDSPIYGKMQASEFVKDLLADTTKSKVTVMNVFIAPGKPDTLAAHFSYQWILKNSQFTNFEGVDVFKMSPEGKIDRLIIIYDTARVKDALGKNKR